MQLMVDKLAGCSALDHVKDEGKPVDIVIKLSVIYIYI
jgi:hypothetical protein